MLSSTPNLRIALVNNMPDGAFVATEKQFIDLVMNATGAKCDVQLFYLPSLTRGSEIGNVIAQRYQPIHKLYQKNMDALIVTGNEPRAARLNDEPYWPEMTKLIDWAKHNTVSTLWSCLAAHAAVLYLDGIERRRMGQKRSGVFTFDVMQKQNHLPRTLNICHSRLNDIPRQALIEKDYQILSQNTAGQVDSFTKSFPSRFLFLQGHPEYDVGSLGREYRRDVERYLKGQRDDYPALPENYYDAEAQAQFESFYQMALVSREPLLIDAFPVAMPKHALSKALKKSAAAIYDLWIANIRDSIKEPALT